MSDTKNEQKSPVTEPSEKRNSDVNKKVRAAQAVGRVKLRNVREYNIIKSSKHYAKGDTEILNAPTAALFKEKGLIAKNDKGKAVKGRPEVELEEPTK